MSQIEQISSIENFLKSKKFFVLNKFFSTPTLSLGTLESILVRIIFYWTFKSQKVLKCHLCHP